MLINLQPEESDSVEEVESDGEDEHEEDDSNIPVPFDIPVEGVNHRLTLPLGISWSKFQWEVAEKLHAFPLDVELSYKLSSQTRADLARALVGEDDFVGLIQRVQPHLNGTKPVGKGKGKEFCVQLFAKIKKGKDDGGKSAPAQTKKVCGGCQEMSRADLLNRGKRTSKKRATLTKMMKRAANRRWRTRQRLQLN